MPGVQPFRPNREPVVDTVEYRSPSVPVWVSRNKPTGSGRKREPSQVEARINQAASKRRVRKLILNFVISTGVLGFVTKFDRVLDCELSGSRCSAFRSD